jgi:hypothetical protein
VVFLIKKLKQGPHAKQGSNVALWMPNRTSCALYIQVKNAKFTLYIVVIMWR